MAFLADGREVLQETLPMLLEAATLLTASLLTAGSKGRRAAGVTVAVSSLGWPWLVPREHTLLRGAFGLIAVFGCARVADLCRGEWPIGSRLLHATSFVDSRTLVRVPRRLDGGPFAAGLVWLGLALAAGCFVCSQPETPTVGYWALRWGAGAVGVYAAIEAGYALAHVGYCAVGLEPPPLHVAPILSRSVQELWGQRWARPVSRWLGESLFLPLARRRRPALGALLAFGASAAFHAYGVWVGLGLVDGLPLTTCMLGYFLVQALVIAMERWLVVRKWKAWAGHAWTVTWMVVTAPLFVEPAAAVLFRGWK